MAVLGVLVVATIPAVAGEITSPARKRELIQRARALYFKYPRVGFKGLQCDVAIPLLDHFDSLFASFLKGNAGTTIAPASRFSLAILADGGWTLKQMLMEDSGSDTVTVGRKKVLDGSKQMLDGYLRMNRSFLFEDMFEQMGSDYRMFEDEDGYRILIDQRGQSSEVRLTRQLVITSLSMKLGGKTMAMELGYTATEDGLLFSRLNLDAGGAVPSYDMKIEYQTVGGMMVPEKMITTVLADSVPDTIRDLYPGFNKSEGTVAIEFIFFNCRTTGK